jgi:hypothetical protein
MENVLNEEDYLGVSLKGATGHIHLSSTTLLSIFLASAFSTLSRIYAKIN